MRYKAEEGAYPHPRQDPGLPERQNVGSNGDAQGKGG